ncbi:hypothetical protein [Streptomyces sp. NPDC050738]|uniref:hypothetical protein n=1 Tax=Streptomyces sp. NPDC050738 TaxID=3154744 RepID=UPI003425EC52
MIKDPGTAWNGPFPYDVLAAVGVTPETTQRDLQKDISFELMLQGLMTPEAQTAWHELRTPDSRLLMDVLMYDVDPAASIAAELAETEAALEDPGVPEEAAQCLALPPLRELSGLVEELDGVALAVPDPPDLPACADPLPPELPHELIRFDR